VSSEDVDLLRARLLDLENAVAYARFLREEKPQNYDAIVAADRAVDRLREQMPGLEYAARKKAESHTQTVPTPERGIEAMRRALRKQTQDETDEPPRSR
jgi:protein-tyrosine-phosphatase